MEHFEKAFRQEIRCPKCGGEVEFNDVIDTNFYDNGTYVDTCVGTCAECEKVYIWEDTFIFHERGELKAAGE